MSKTYWYYKIAAINLATRGLLYTCLLPLKFLILCASILYKWKNECMIRYKHCMLSLFCNRFESLLLTFWFLAPSEPRNLSVHQKGHSYIYIKWQKPEHANGLITNYTINYECLDNCDEHYHSFTVLEDDLNELDEEFYGYVISDLFTYWRYKVRVSANTFSSGKYSEIEVRTSAAGEYCFQIQTSLDFLI